MRAHGCNHGTDKTKNWNKKKNEGRREVKLRLYFVQHQILPGFSHTNHCRPNELMNYWANKSKAIQRVWPLLSKRKTGEPARLLTSYGSWSDRGWSLWMRHTLYSMCRWLIMIIWPWSFGQLLCSDRWWPHHPHPCLWPCCQCFRRWFRPPQCFPILQARIRF